jgi:lipopolysaccharide export system permease protein
MFIKVLDRYIIRQFFGGFVFALMLIVSIAMTIDIGEHLGKFVQHNLSLGDIFGGYYFYFIPYMIGLMGPYFVFITVIYFTSRLTNKSEIIAMFNSGMSFRRFLAPYVGTSIFLALCFWYAINYLIPYSDKQRLVFENKYYAYNSQSSDNNIHRRIDDSTFFYFRVYDNMQKTAFNVSIEKIVDGKLKSKTLAERGIYDTLTLTWELKNYFTRTIDAQQHESISKGESLKTSITMDPTILVKRWTHTQELDRSELKDLIESLKTQGSDARLYEIEYHKRSAKCFGVIILTIIGVVLASKKVRGGLGLHLMLGLTLGSVYELTAKLFDTFALKANLDPMLAAWCPNILYMLLAWYLWKKMQE